MPKLYVWQYNSFHYCPFAAANIRFPGRDLLLIITFVGTSKIAFVSLFGIPAELSS